MCFLRGKQYFLKPTLHSLFCNRFCRRGRSKCRTRPGTGCTLHTSGRLHATPGRGRLGVCTGHGSDFHSLHTLRIQASLQKEKRGIWTTESCKKKKATIGYKPRQRFNFNALQFWETLTSEPCQFCLGCALLKRVQLLVLCNGWRFEHSFKSK